MHPNQFWIVQLGTFRKKAKKKKRNRTFARAVIIGLRSFVARHIYNPM